MSDLEAARAFVVQHGSEFVGCTDEERYALIAAFATRIRAEALREVEQLVRVRAKLNPDGTNLKDADAILEAICLLAIAAEKKR